MVMLAAQLITRPPSGMAAPHRCGERELDNFEQVAGGRDFTEKYLRYASVEHIRSRPKQKLTMSKKLRKNQLKLDVIWISSNRPDCGYDELPG